MTTLDESGLVVFNTDEINNVYLACYPATTYFEPEWSGTAIDAMNKTEIPVGDRIWLVVRPQLLGPSSSERFAYLARMFAVWCARQIQSDLTDQRSLDALDSAEMVAAGEIGNSIEIERLAWIAFEEATTDAEKIAAKAAAFTLNPTPKKAAECASFVAANGDAERGAAQIEQLKSIILAEAGS